MNLFGGIYRDRRVLLTGHTGFKGSWLALWLHQMGADVTGLGLSPATNPCHWSLLGLPIKDHRVDVRDAAAVRQVLESTRPEIVFHLAAQPLVRRSYREPLETWSTNVMGTANVIDATRYVPNIKAIVVITTDKCYANMEWPWGYRENDRLGGHDPYSASKAATELVVSSFRSSFFNGQSGPLLATARAGNVIGGGDWSEDRLFPDLVRAAARDLLLEVRAPQATRPWQHVLDSLSGYLLLGQRLLASDRSAADAWNFGPDPDGNLSVLEVLNRFMPHWPGVRCQVTATPQPHESTLLYLDSAKARSLLDWKPVWKIDRALEYTAQWYRQWFSAREVLSREQLSAFIAAAAENNESWAHA